MSWWKKIKQLISGTPDLDLSDLKTTDNRGYSAINVQKINKALDSIPPIRRAVILANIIEESGADPHVKGDVDGNSTGLLQWRPERLDPESPHLKDLKSQLKYITTTLASPKNIDDAWTHGGAGSGFKSWKMLNISFIILSHLLKRLIKLLLEDMWDLRVKIKLQIIV